MTQLETPALNQSPLIESTSLLFYHFFLFVTVAAMLTSLDKSWHHSRYDFADIAPLNQCFRREVHNHNFKCRIHVAAVRCVYMSSTILALPDLSDMFPRQICDL